MRSQATRTAKTAAQNAAPRPRLAGRRLARGNSSCDHSGCATASRGAAVEDVAPWATGFLTVEDTAETLICKAGSLSEGWNGRNEFRGDFVLRRRERRNATGPGSHGATGEGEFVLRRRVGGA